LLVLLPLLLLADAVVRSVLKLGKLVMDVNSDVNDCILVESCVNQLIRRRPVVVVVVVAEFEWELDEHDD
jgi:hypothetical protein